jgi:transmembrane sensor
VLATARGAHAEGIETTVSGTIGLGRAATVLPAGSVAIATPAGLRVDTGSVAEAEGLVGWRDGVLVFHDTALSEAAAEFNRYSARRIVVADAGVGALRIGGSFRWSNAEGFVRLLEQGFPVRADYGRDEIVLHAP